MQGNIIITMENGDITLPYTIENHSHLIALLSEQKSSIKKLVFNQINCSETEMKAIFSALKTNQFVTEIKFEYCQLYTPFLLNEITSLIQLPRELAENTTTIHDENDILHNSTSATTETQKVTDTLTINRNHRLQKISVNNKEIDNIGLALNKMITTTQTPALNFEELNRFIAGYYLSRANEFHIQRQYANAFNAAIYGLKIISQIITASPNESDDSAKIKFSMILGDIYAKREMYSLATKHYNEASLLILKIPRNKRPDEHWKNLLVIETALTTISNKNTTTTDKTPVTHHAINALFNFFAIKDKTQNDIRNATNAAKMLATSDSMASKFIYDAIFNTASYLWNIPETLNLIELELQAEKHEKLRYLFIEILLFIINENNTKYFLNPGFSDFLKLKKNVSILEKLLIEITIMNIPENPTHLPEDKFVAVKKVATNSSLFFEPTIGANQFKSTEILYSHKIRYA